MNLTSQYVLHISIFITFVFAIVIFVFKRRAMSTVSANLPPGSKGWPLIGETLEFAMARRNGELEKFINERTFRYSSDVFKTSLAGQNVVVFCGDLGNKFLLSTGNKNFKPWIPKHMVRVVGLTGDEGLKFYGLLPEFLKSEALEYYLPIMDSMTKEHLENYWLPYEQVKVHELIKKFTFSLSCRLFMNINDPNEIIGLQDPFTTIFEGFLSIPINFPGTPYRLCLKAGNIIREKLVVIINKRRSELSDSKSDSYKDILSRMLRELSSMSENGISNGIIGLLFASHDTITSAITCTIKYLAENPQIYKEVLREQIEIAESKELEESLNLSDFQKMKYSWCVARESMRLAPPVMGTFREAINDVTYKGFTIPKGWKGYWTPSSTHKNPNYFKEPNKFDPSRFEGEGPAPYSYIPFSAGPHTCKGKEYARLIILVFMHNLVRKFQWESVIQDEKIIQLGVSVPANGLPIRIKSHMC